MGTKSKPGMFDCYTAAELDEPLFILRSTDENAPETVRYWATKYRQRKICQADWGEKQTRKFLEALDTADAMQDYRERYQGVVDLDPLVVPLEEETAEKVEKTS